MRRYADRRDTNEQPIRTYLERCGCKVKPISQKGVPDLMVSGGPLGPFVVMLEVKSNNGDLTSEQKVFFKDFGNSFVYVVRSRSDAKEVLRLFMPVRIYQCETCGLFEKKQKFSELPLTACPTCEKTVRQKYCVPYIVYKGSGWTGALSTN